MPFNGSGTFTLVAGNPVVTGTVISSTVHNNTTSDFATGFTNCVTRDGQSAALSNLPMGGFKHTGASSASATGEYLTYGQTGASLSSLTVGTFTVTGNFSVGGNLTLGDAAADTLTINPNTVTWNAGSVTHSGSHTFSSVTSASLALTSGAITTGTYTPTLTSVLNISGSSASVCSWVRVGNVVTVFGAISVGATAASTATQIGISLPVASNFSAAENCGGVAASGGAGGIVPQAYAAISADAANDRADLLFVAPSNLNFAFKFTFSYRVI